MTRSGARKSISSSDSGSSDSDSDSTTTHRPSASTVINSFLGPSQTAQRIQTAKTRKASDVINAFLNKTKIVNQANTSQFNSALDVINKYLNRGDQRVTRSLARRKPRTESSDDSSSSSDSSEVDSVAVARQNRRRELLETSSDSDSSASGNVAATTTIENQTRDPEQRRLTDLTDSTKNAAERIKTENSQTVQPSNEVPPAEQSVDPQPSNGTPSWFCQIPRETYQQCKRRMDSMESSADWTASGSHSPRNVAKRVKVEDSQTIQPSSVASTEQADHPQPSTDLPSSSSVPDERGDETPCVTPSSNQNEQNASTAIPTKGTRWRKGVKMTFTREVYSRKFRTKRVVQQAAIIRGKGDFSRFIPPDERFQTLKLSSEYDIPKHKYDRALAMLNAPECRYDETPIDYAEAVTTWYDFRQLCETRRHNEATYNMFKLSAAQPISLTRIVFELDNCLKTENWQQMAELIYFGCGLLKTEQSRRAIGMSFFTVGPLSITLLWLHSLKSFDLFVSFQYALLLILLGSPTATVHGKSKEVLQFLEALGSDPEENAEFLKELQLVMDEGDVSDGMLTIKEEESD